MRRALDLFCGGGGAARGILAAGFDEVVGIDIADHRRAYPGLFVRGDALRPPVRLEDFDFVWASPPCQRFSAALNGTPHVRARWPDMTAPVRALLDGHPWTVIENVPNSPLRPDLTLTGPQCGLPTLLRKRVFELSFPALAPPMAHAPGTYMDGTLVTVTTTGGMCSKTRKKAMLLTGPLGDRARAGRFLKADMAEAMGLPVSMTTREIGEAVPPAYAKFIAREALRQMERFG